MSVTLKTRQQLVEEWIRRFIAVTPEVTYFGSNGVVQGFARSTGALAAQAYLLYVALLRRLTLQAAQGAALTERAAEAGATRRGGVRAKLLIVVVPFAAQVLSITTGATDLIEVDDSSGLLAGDEIRVVNGDGTETETATIIAITTGTGPNGGDELEVAPLTGTYSPSTDTVRVILRTTVPTGTQITTATGISFQTLAPVVTSDANPVLAGETGALALADKVWCEAVNTGADGNVDAGSVTGFTPAIRGLTPANPEPGTGGADTENDLDLKYRAMHQGTLANQETLAWIETLCGASNQEALRAVRRPVASAGTLGIAVLKRNGGTFNNADLLAMQAYADARVRSYMVTSIDNVLLTAVEVEAQITLDPDTDLRTVYVAAAARLADYLDFRKWPFGQTVDEAALLSIVQQTPGVASLVTATFQPASDVAVAATSLPTLARLSLQDTTTGAAINADLALGF